MKKRNTADPLKINRYDIILTAALAAAAVICVILFAGFHDTSEGAFVRITVDAEEYGIYELSQPVQIRIETDRGNNLIQIRDHQVTMLEADCPDGYCIRKGPISRIGDTIVCLPHRVVAEILSADGHADEFDVIAQ